MCERGVEGNGDYEEAGCADGYDRKIGGYHTLASEKKGKDLALRMQSCSTKVCAGHSTRTVPVLYNQWEEDPSTHHLHKKYNIPFHERLSSSSDRDKNILVSRKAIGIMIPVIFWH